MFGKVISLSENPSFSYRFSQYVILQMLRVKKQYEIWFLVDGNPVTISLHTTEK
ncbi:unnamed protein product [Brassica rapa subsp. narinosa]